MNGDDIARRLLDFSVEVLGVSARLLPRPGARHVGSQLIRSGTAGGAHYAEARGAESRADFVHKVRLAAKEVRESMYWLTLIARADLAAGRHLPHARTVGQLVQEAGELAAILAASARTAAREG